MSGPFAPRMLGAVALGGMAGAAARHGVSQIWETTDGGFPVATFVENVVGSLLLGMVMVFVARRSSPGSLVRPFVAVGFLGSFTTFSALIVEGELLVRDGDGAVAAIYWTATVVVGLAAALVGIVATSRVLTARTTPE